MRSGWGALYLRDGGQVIGEWDGTSWTKEYVWLGSTLLATVEGSTIKYHHADHLSIRATTFADGMVGEEQGHYPFGEPWYETSSETTRIFTTYEREAGGSLDYAMFRWMGPEAGRFLSADPVPGSMGDGQSWNRYAYSLNDPVNLVDTLGLAPSPFHLSYEPEGGGGFGYLPWDTDLETGRPIGEGNLSIDGIPYAGDPNPPLIEVCFFECNSSGDHCVKRCITVGGPPSDSTPGGQPGGGGGGGTPQTPTDETDNCPVSSCLSSCLADQLGVHTAFGAAGAASGFNVIPAPGKPPGATPGTSPSSKFLSRMFPQRTPSRWWTPTLNNPWARSQIVGRIAGRWVPIVGWGVLVLDASAVTLCTGHCSSCGGS